MTEGKKKPISEQEATDIVGGNHVCNSPCSKCSCSCSWPPHCTCANVPANQKHGHT